MICWDMEKSGIRTDDQLLHFHATPSTIASFHTKDEELWAIWAMQLTKAANVLER
jgi:hypothetical protein